MNQALGNAGKTVVYTQPVEAEPVNQLESLRDLVADMNAGRVDLLLIVGGNPVYTAPADLEFADALAKPQLRVHLSLYSDETSALCHWQIPEAHFLEAWSDARGYDGTVSIVQPLIAPLYGGKSAHELLAAMSDRPERSAYDIVREFWGAPQAVAGVSGPATGSGRPQTAETRTLPKPEFDDYDVVVMGVANMLEPYRDRVVVAELDTGGRSRTTVDIVLYDSFAQPESDQQEIKVLVDNPRARRVVVYTWNFHPDLVRKRARAGGERLPVQGPAGSGAGRRARGRPRRRGRGERPAEPVTQLRQPGLARTARGPDRPRVGDPGADHAGQEQRRGGGADLSEPQHGEVLHPHASTARSTSTAAPRPCCGAYNGFPPDHHRIEHWRGGP